MRALLANGLMGAVAALLVTALIACPPTPKPPTPDASDAAIITEAGPTEDPDGALRSPDCKAACDNLKNLRDPTHPNGCPEAQAFDGGGSCYRVCTDAEAGGKINLKPKCLAAARTIQELRACGTVRCKE